MTTSSGLGRRMNWLPFSQEMSHNSQHIEGELFPGTTKEHAPWCPEFGLLESLVVRLQGPSWNHNWYRDTVCDMNHTGSGGDCTKLERQCLFWRCIPRCLDDYGYTRWVCTYHTGGFPGVEVIVRANKGLFTPVAYELFTSRLLLHRQENEDRRKGNPIVFYHPARVLSTQIEMIFTAYQCCRPLRRATLPKAWRDRRSSQYKLEKSSGFWKKKKRRSRSKLLLNHFLKSSTDIWQTIDCT